METLRGLWDSLVDAVADNGGRTSDRAAAILAQIETLETTLRMGARLLGMVSPFAPAINLKPGASRVPVTIGVAMEAPAPSPVRYPWMQQVADFLQAKKLITATEWRQLGQATRREVLHAPGIEDREVLRRLRDQVAESVQAGETPVQFRERIRGTVDLAKAQSETLIRTNSKQGYLVGKERTLKDPAVKEQFPYVEYVATDDARVRPEHLAADGDIVEVGTPEYNVLRRQMMDYNCRCDFIPLSEERAREKGNIKGIDELPEESRKKYSEPSPSEAAPIPAPVPVLRTPPPRPEPAPESVDQTLEPLRLPASEERAAKQWSDNLLSEEADAISEYFIGNSTGFRRRITAGELDENDKMFLRALNKAPAVQGTVYRGMEAEGTDLIEQFERAGVGGVWSDLAPHGMSKDPDIAIDFATPDRSGIQPNIVFRVKTKTGRNVSPAGITNEQEVLGMRGATYRITAIAPNAKMEVPGGLPAETAKLLVDLEEI